MRMRPDVRSRRARPTTTAITKRVCDLFGKPAFAACLLLPLVLGGCAAYGDVVVDSRPYPAYPEPAVHVPPGHLPPPGACRIWFPDRPPGQQPPPGDCYELERRVPVGAVLIQG